MSLQNAPPEQKFHFNNGKSAQNIWELKKQIQVMNQDEFGNHVNETKNDFANWIDQVIHDPYLAGKIRLAKDKNETVKILDDKIHEITMEIGKSHVISDFELMKDFLLGLVIGFVVGIALGVFVL
ncbi:hypothetical protein C4573_03880 [Candidatus Woesearchaeota archaeon]|nr:MAG: hypothetical protein C4573_03880 [Candidatus Woesearchaeota archaeon]